MLSSDRPERPLCQKAWDLVVAAAPAGVQHKAFHMRADTLACLLRERGIETPGSHGPSNPHLQNCRIYSIRVILDPLMRFGEITLEKR